MQHQPPLSRLPRRTIALLAALITALGLLNAVQPLNPPAHADEATTDGEFVPLWASPLLETKTGIGTPNGQVQKVPANGAMTFQALGQGGLPASGVSAASLAVHAVAPTSTGFLSVYPSDKPTTISTVSFVAGESSTNADLTQITATGQITVANGSDQPVDVLVAVDGYFKSGGAATTVYKPLATAVLWDTRAQYATGTPARTTPMDPWSSIEVQVAGQVGIPTQCDQSAAVALNMVALEQTNDGELKVEPTDSPIGVGTLQFTANDWNNSTFSIVQMGCSGKLRVTNSSPGTVNVSISVRGYFTYWDADDRGARYKPAEPTTILDTAAGVGTNGSTNPMNGESHLIFDAAGPSGVPVNTVSAVAMQIKVINPTQPGWITFRPEDQAEIPISSMVYQAGENASGFETQIPSGLGRIAITNHGTGSLHVQITVRGFYIHKTVEVIEGEMPAPTSQTEQTEQDALAVQAANDAAFDNSGLAPTSYDPVTKKVITTAATPAALATAAQPIEAPVAQPSNVADDELPVEEVPDGVDVEEAPEPAAPPTTTVTPIAVLAPNNTQNLYAIKEEVLTLDETQLPGANTIKATYIEPEKNRVIVEATSAPVELQDGLTTRYGPSKVAINVIDPSSANFVFSACSGGSRVCVGPGTGYKFAGGITLKHDWVEVTYEEGICSSGFVWKNQNGQYYMVTAGHCADTSDSAAKRTFYSANAQTLGIVDWSSWRYGKPFKRASPLSMPPIGPRYAGDVSFIRMQSTYVNGIIYGGPPGVTGRKRYKVKESLTWRRARRGDDKICISGQTTGENCGWHVSNPGKDSKIAESELVVLSKKNGRCADIGDSGGPVFQKIENSSGAVVGVRAFGILSGINGAISFNCKAYITNIADVRWTGGGNAVLAQ